MIEKDEFRKQLNLVQEAEVSVKENGDTSFHFVLRHWPKPKIVEYLDTKDPTYLTQMAITANNEGELPFDIALTNHDYEIKNLVISLTLSATIKPSDELLNSKKILSEGKYSVDGELYNNMMVACVVANKARSLIKKSTTHPNMNDASNEERTNLTNKLKQLRINRASHHLLSYWKMLLVTSPVDLLFHYYDTFVHYNTQPFIKAGVGNCGEMSYVAYNYIKKMYRHVKAEVCEVDNGDHAFLVIGEGSNRVVCDPWAGDVYPFDDIPEKLRCCKRYNISSNLYIHACPQYNPRFHSIKLMPLKTPIIFIFASIIVLPILLLARVGIYLGLALTSLFYNTIITPTHYRSPTC